jgi:LacI family transcriptional regulator
MASNRNVTINDVAAAAGVSRATVSRALSGYGRINQSTVDHVHKVAEGLGYKQNALAAALRAGKTKTIGLVVISDFTNAFFDRATKAIIDQAKELGYRVLISHTDEDVEVEKLAVETMLSNQVDGLILVPSSTKKHSHLTPKKLGNKPVVIIHGDFLHTKIIGCLKTGQEDRIITYAIKVVDFDEAPLPSLILNY